MDIERLATDAVLLLLFGGEVAKRRRHQGVDFVVSHYRKIVRDPMATIAQRMKALDRLSVIDEILTIQLVEPNDNTRKPEPSAPVDAEDKVQKALSEILGRKKSKKGEKNGLSNGRKETDTGVR